MLIQQPANKFPARKLRWNDKILKIDVATATMINKS